MVASWSTPLRDISGDIIQERSAELGQQFSEHVLDATDGFTYLASDGSSTSGTTVLLTVNAVNDAPTVNLAVIPTIIEDGGPQSVANFASFNAGPGESQSLLGYTVGNISNPAMFMQTITAAMGGGSPLLSGMTAPPDTGLVLAAAEGVIEGFNRMFAGYGRAAAQAGQPRTIPIIVRIELQRVAERHGILAAL